MLQACRIENIKDRFVGLCNANFNTFIAYLLHVTFHFLGTCIFFNEIIDGKYMRLLMTFIIFSLKITM